MHDFSPRAPAPREALLTPPAVPDEGGPLRQRLLGQTTAVLRRRRRLRRLARAAGLAACYAAGLVTMHGLAPRPPLPPPAEVAQQSPTPRPPAAEPVPEPPALALEWQAFDSPDRGAELYRQAGDRYLSEEADPAAALRCYGN